MNNWRNLSFATLRRCSTSTSMPEASGLADRIADAVLSKFDSLPAKYKPTRDSRGDRWVPLSGIVVENEDSQLECISLATGMKCLPASKIPSVKGRVLHDSHAEILALRALNHLLLRECLTLQMDEGYQSKFVINMSSPELLFAILPGLKFHMYSSEAPCGDASMELIMNKQNDQTPWTTDPAEQLLGRGNFSRLGVVRRKPSRGDSPETLSKSCSDKLALKQCIGFLSSHTSCFIDPENTYLASLVVPESQHVATAMQRSFGPQGRLASLVTTPLPGGYVYRPFSVLTTTREFQFSKRAMPQSEQVATGSNMATIWNPFMQEVIINGVLQGSKSTDKKCASMVSRSLLMHYVKDITDMCWISSPTSYTQFKLTHEQHKWRTEAKKRVIDQALHGWIRNADDDFDV